MNNRIFYTDFIELIESANKKGLIPLHIYEEEVPAHNQMIQNIEIISLI